MKLYFTGKYLPDDIKGRAKRGELTNEERELIRNENLYRRKILLGSQKSLDDLLLTNTRAKFSKISE